MVSVVDIMGKAFYDMLIYGEKLINEDFMIGVFDGITKKLLPLQEYLNFMLENKQGNLVDSRKEKEKFLPWYLLQSELFILLANILSILTHFVLNSHIKQHQYSELKSGTSARTQLSTYL